MRRYVQLSLFLFLPALISADDSAPSLDIFPQTFNFGWCPDNAKISAEYTIKNTTPDLIALTHVMPACGCTATDFTPANLEANKESKVKLTFDTRGYANVNFSKTATIVAGHPEKEYTVGLTGFVTDAHAKVAPIGDGIFSFLADSKEIEKSIEILNKSSETVKIKTVLAPADWVKLNFPSEIPAGKTITMTAAAAGNLSEERNTSTTLEVSSLSETSYLTVAFLSGKAPEPIRKIKSIKPAKKTVPSLDVSKPGSETDKK